MTENKYVGETRDGFFVRPMVQRVWDVQIDILKEIDRICKKHNIMWYGDWGTLLGAVRAGGYIPWDDDVDISMRRLDFERFKRYAVSELPKEYVCQMDRDQNLSDLVFRVKNCATRDLSEKHLLQNHGCPYSVGVDIFVYDNIPDDMAEREAYIAVFTYTFAAAADLKGDELYDQISGERKELIETAERMTGVHLDRMQPVRGQLISLADQVAAMYYDEDTKDIAQVCYLPHNSVYAFRREWFENVVYLPFEGIELPVPAGYDFVLERWYGRDYMTPVRSYDHAYPYFKGQEEELFRYYRENNMDIPECFRQ